MEFKRPRISVVLLIASFATAGFAQSDGRRGPDGPRGPRRPPPGLGAELPDVVLKCLRNYGKLRYTGTRSVEFRNQGDRVINREFLTVDGFRSRTEFSDESASKGQIIVENDRERLHFFPASNEIFVSPRVKDETIQRLRTMFGTRKDGRWTFSVSPGGNLAARATTLLTATDRSGNPFQKLWFDNDTGLILKREIFDRVGTRVGWFEFSQINFRPNISAADFEIKRRGAKLVRAPEHMRTIAAEHGFAPVRLTSPEAVLHTAKVIPGPSGKIFIQTYVVKGARVSLYQLSARVNGDHLSQQLGKNLNSHRWTYQGRNFVLIGDLDIAALKRLADGAK